MCMFNATVTLQRAFERSSSMNHKEELMAYIQSLSAEQAKEALAIASAWLLARQEATRRPHQKESLQSQSTP